MKNVMVHFRMVVIAVLSCLETGLERLLGAGRGLGRYPCSWRLENSRLPMLVANQHCTIGTRHPNLQNFRTKPGQARSRQLVWACRFVAACQSASSPGALRINESTSKMIVGCCDNPGVYTNKIERAHTAHELARRDDSFTPKQLHAQASEIESRVRVCQPSPASVASTRTWSPGSPKERGPSERGRAPTLRRTTSYSS